MKQHFRTISLIAVCAFIYGVFVLPQASLYLGMDSGGPAAVWGTTGAPTISSQPSNVSISTGQQFNVRVKVKSASSVTYAWYRNGQQIQGLNSYMWYVASASYVPDAGQYYVVVTNKYGSVTSKTVTVKVDGQAPQAAPAPGSGGESTPAPGAPTITTQPVTQSIDTGKQFNVNVKINSDTPVSYVWYRNGQQIAGWNFDMWYVAEADPSVDAGQYYVVVSNSAGSVTSQTATVTVGGQSGGGTTPTPTPVPTPDPTPSVSSPVFTTQPASQTVAQGGSAKFTTNVQSSEAVTYQWYKNSTPISGKTSASLSFSSAASSDAGSYYVTAKNSGGITQSNTVTLTVNAPTPTPAPTVAGPTIVTQPFASTPSNTAASVTITPGSDYLYIYAEATGDNITYTWYQNGTAIPNSNNVSLWYNPAQSAQVGTYYVKITNAGGSVTSNSVVVASAGAPAPTPTPTPAPSVPAPTISQTLFANTPSQTASAVTFTPGSDYLYISLTATGDNLSYTWYKNGAVMSGESVGYLWYNPAQSSQAGTYYVVVSNGGGSVTSNTITVTATGSPAPAPTPSPVTSGSNKAQIGACGSCDHLPGVQSFENTIGGKEDYVLAWGWADTMNNFKYAVHYIDEEWPAGQYYLEWDMPMIVQGTTFNQTVQGVNDAGYIEWAKTIAARDPYARVRIGHEQNGTWYDWSMNGPAGTSAEFAAAYRHIVTVMRQYGPNLKFIFNPGAGVYAGNDWTLTYPGDAYVDYISFDQYEDGPWLPTDANERWNHFLTQDLGLNFLADYAKQHGKRIGFDEWGTNIDDGTYITHMADWMSTHDVAYQMYWDSSAAFEGKLVNQPTNLAAFKKYFSK